MLNLTAAAPAASVQVPYQRIFAVLGTLDLKLDLPLSPAVISSATLPYGCTWQRCAAGSRCLLVLPLDPFPSRGLKSCRWLTRVCTSCGPGPGAAIALSCFQEQRGEGLWCICFAIFLITFRSLVRAE